MSMTDAVAFLERTETDKEFGADTETVKGDQQAVLAKVRAYGYDVSPEEITERYGAELTPDSSRRSLPVMTAWTSRPPWPSGPPRA